MVNNLNKKVFKIWSYCISDDIYDELGEGTLGDYVYKQDKLEEKKEELEEILNTIDINKENLKFSDLGYTKSGEKWAKSNQRIDFLSSMLNASGLLKYEEYPLTYEKNKINPKIKVLKK